MLGLFRRFTKSARPANRSGHPAGFRPQVEGLGGSTSASGGRRRPVRPQAEQLEERRLMSSSGVISAVTDNAGRTAVFALGTDQHVYQYVPSSGSWQALSDTSAGAFRQVSAGLDGSGRAVCYALHASDGAVWRLDSYQQSPSGPAGGFVYDETSLGYTAAQISATRNNECFAIRPNSPADQVGIYNGYSNSWSTWAGPQGGLAQISTGLDRYGRDEVYLLGVSRQVYLLDYGTYTVLPFQATQLSAGAGPNRTGIDLFFIDASSSHNAWHFDGSTYVLMMTGASQVSAGLDQYGNEVMYGIEASSHRVYRTGPSVSGEWEWVNVSQISAAGNDMVFAVGAANNSVWAFDRSGAWGAYWSATGNWGNVGWHPLYGTTVSPVYFPLAA